MPATLEATLGLNLLTPKALERMEDSLPTGVYAPLHWYVGELADASRPLLRATSLAEARDALTHNIAKFAVVRMRLLEFLFDLVGGEGARLLNLLREISKETSEGFIDEAEAVVGKPASLYLAQALGLAEAGLDRIERAAQASQGFNWKLHAEQELTLRTWALRSDALLVACAIGVSEPEIVADDDVLAELCRVCYETAVQHFVLLERAVSIGQGAEASSNDLLDEFRIEEPSWVHALEADDWNR